MSKILALLYEFAENDLDVSVLDNDTFEISVKKKYFPELFGRLTNFNVVIEHLVLGGTEDAYCTCVFRKFVPKND